MLLTTAQIVTSNGAVVEESITLTKKRVHYQRHDKRHDFTTKCRHYKQKYKHKCKKKGASQKQSSQSSDEHTRQWGDRADYTYASSNGA